MGLRKLFKKADDAFRNSHTVGQFTEDVTGSEGWGLLADPAYKTVQKEADPYAFGYIDESGKSHSGIVDNPIGGAIANYFSWGAAGAVNSASDYKQAKDAGYDVDYGQAVAKPAVTGAALSYVGSQNPYGYGYSNLGKAGTAATTSGLYSASQGQDFDQQLRNAAIAGGSSYAGSTARDAYTDAIGGGPVEPDRQKAANQLGSLTSNASNLGLRTLWKDPNATDPDYSGIINQFNSARNQITNQNSEEFDPQALQELQNTPQGQQLAALFEQDQKTSGKKVTAGGAGQYASGGDQLEQSEGWGELYAS
jgi:hypothetical protein